LVGDGPSRSSIAGKIDEHGLGNHVFISGFVPPEKVRDYLLDSDAFVFPSAFEGMSNSLLEAVLFGLPVIATDIPPNRELLGQVEGSTLIPVGSVKDLYLALEDLKEHLEARKQMASSSARKLVKLFSIERAANDYERIL
jgi:glycosyltransferase involved in cell wall biosynthesis